MDNELFSDDQRRKRNEQPPDKRKRQSTQPAKRLGRHAVQESSSPKRTRPMKTQKALDTTQSELEDQGQEGVAAERVATPFYQFLRTIMHHDRAEIARVAHELNVANNTVYRWLNGISEPRPGHLRRLPDIFPNHREELTALINTTFGNIINTTTDGLREHDENIYQRILEVAAHSQDDEVRFWDVSQIIFTHALQYLDPNQQGMAITYATLMPPHADGIHSLREILMHGHAPWSAKIGCKAFLGSNTLAGTAATTQHIQVWNEIDGARSVVEIDTYEHSACAVPVIRSGRLAGVLIISSALPDFFKNDHIEQAVTNYSFMMNVALSDRDFQSFERLNLRPMPNLAWQRQQLSEDYVHRIVRYAYDHQALYQEAERKIQCEVELEFEQEARTI